MNDFVMSIILNYYDKEVIEIINAKYGIEYMECLKRFLNSKTYQMLIDKSLEMWDFSPKGIFDMWESEQITNDPRNSIYIRGE